MGRKFRYLKLRERKSQSRVIFVGMIAVVFIVFQSGLLSYRTALQSLLPNRDFPVLERESFNNYMHTSVKCVTAQDLLSVNGSDTRVLDDSRSIGIGVEAHICTEEQRTEKGVNVYKEEYGSFSDHMNESFVPRGAEKEEDAYFRKETSGKDSGLHLDQAVAPEVEIASKNYLAHNTSLAAVSSTTNVSLMKDSVSVWEHQVGIQTDLVSALQKDISRGSNEVTRMGKSRIKISPKRVTSMSEINRISMQCLNSSQPKIGLWPLLRDQEISDATLHNGDTPSLIHDQELYAPVFRNVSVFKRSYEIMEKKLKIYMYKDGQKPIFHRPILEGIYASEGWFMKLMQKNKQFVVNDPHKAHLFYMPFSSLMLKRTLYVANSSTMAALRQYLKGYSAEIAARYPYWNRTGGADHFFVACHDSAPYVTRHHMEHCIRVVCNADVTRGFKMGRDVSLPETYIHSQGNTLRYLGGKPPSQRHILAFYAGKMHGYLRPILLEYWKDRDPSMKINGPMPKGVKRKMKYIEHMKSSKYCICPKGNDVNSPRIVESILYDCVPVIISDNFVPPFFDILNWEAFSVIIEEKDIPDLKNILLSIPEDKYLKMQLGVNNVQRHFLWHAEPVKYDLFHMILHSIWYGRIFHLKFKQG